MMRNEILAAAAAALVVIGCASPQSAEDLIPRMVVQSLPDTLPAEPVSIELQSDTSAAFADEGVPGDSLIGAMLETARQHYLSASSAAAMGDSLRSVVQFEEAISLLDVLGETLMQSGNKQGALEVINQIVLMNPPNVEDYRKLLFQMQNS